MDKKHEIWGCGCFLYCPLHTAAPALLVALEGMLELFGAPYGLTYAPDRVSKARAAIAQAKGETA